VYDVAPFQGVGLSSGVTPRPVGTLVDRALAFLNEGPADSLTLAVHVLGVPQATETIADRLAAALLAADPRVTRRADSRWELVRSSTKDISLSQCAFAVVDVETTGMSPRSGDRVIEVAVAVRHGDEVELVFDSLIDPKRSIPEMITGITNISHDMVVGKPTFEDVAGDLLDELTGRVFVAHNVKFDWSFVSSELRRARDVELDGPKLCTVRLSQKLLPALKSKNLDSVSRYFGVDIEGRHRAAGDAIATAKILGHLFDLAEDQGITTLDGLIDLTRPQNGQKKKKRRAAPHSTDQA